MLKEIIYKLCLLRNKIFDRDDFNWNKYHICYANEIKECEKHHTLKLSNDFKITDGNLEFYCNPSLHKNAELLYRIIQDLNPKLVLEVGCGCGDHLHNIKKLLPETKIAGYDLLQKQLDFLNKRNPELKGRTFTHDITKVPVFKSELIYTQAVIMHIQKGDRHIDALRNLINSADKYIVLMENWSRHNFFQDIQNISLGLEEDLYIYKVDSGEQIMMVLSKVPIKNKKLDYIELKSNDEMLKYIE